MHVYTSEQVSPFAWIFTINGLLFLAIIGLAIWFIWKYIKNRNDDKDSEIPLADKKFDEGHLDETSFWENNFEEYKVEEKVDFKPVGNGLYEKDCTKQVVEDDVLFDDVVQENIDEETDVKIYKKE